MENTLEIFIYCFKHPKTNELKYIGKTINLKQRFHQHFNIRLLNQKKTKLSNWLLKVIKEHGKPIIEIIEVANESNWTEREKYWIKKYRHLNLCNITNGGEGKHGCKLSEKHIENIKIAARKRKGIKLNYPSNRKGSIVSQQTKNKISIKKQGISVNEKVVVMLNDNQKPIKIFKSLKDGSEYSGVSVTSISNNLIGISKKTKNGIWRLF